MGKVCCRSAYQFIPWKQYTISIYFCSRIIVQIIITEMRFFQFQQEKNVDFRCMHIRQINQKSAKVVTRLSKKPYERYKDMRLAIKLLEKGQNPIFKSFDQANPPPTATPTTLDHSFTHTATHTHMQFPSHRLRVGFQRTSGVKYRSYLLRATSVDRFRMI